MRIEFSNSGLILWFEYVCKFFLLTVYSKLIQTLCCKITAAKVQVSVLAVIFEQRELYKHMDGENRAFRNR